MKFRVILDNFKDINKAYRASESQISNLIGAQTGRKFTEFRHSFDAEAIYEIIREKQIHVITQEDERFPKSLLDISDPPICLYLKGDPGLLSRTDTFYFSVVGSRRGTPYGVKIARKLVSDLITQIADCCIVSGLAYTIDATAHETSLDHHAKTIAFLGCGVDIMYPYGNKRLYQRIVDEGGAIVSEFPPGETVAPGLFIARNRLISGISRGILVVEGSRKSGSLITARYAAEQGKDVFAVPGPVDSVMSEAPNLLLREGAILTSTVDDILDAYDVKKRTILQPNIQSSLSQEEQSICAYLSRVPRLLDEIVGNLQFPIQSTVQALSRLEIQGLIERGLDEKYTVKAISPV